MYRILTESSRKFTATNGSSSLKIDSAPSAQPCEEGTDGNFWGKKTSCRGKGQDRNKKVIEVEGLIEICWERGREEFCNCNSDLFSSLELCEASKRGEKTRRNVE